MGPSGRLSTRAVQTRTSLVTARRYTRGYHTCSNAPNKVRPCHGEAQAPLPSNFVRRNFSKRVAMVIAVLTVGLPHARCASGNRTSSIWMGHAAAVALFKAKFL